MWLQTRRDSDDLLHLRCSVIEALPYSSESFPKGKVGDLEGSCLKWLNQNIACTRVCVLLPPTRQMWLISSMYVSYPESNFTSQRPWRSQAKHKSCIEMAKIRLLRPLSKSQLRRIQETLQDMVPFISLCSLPVASNSEQMELISVEQTLFFGLSELPGQG